MDLWPLILSIQTRRAGLNYLQFSPSHHFPCWSLSLSSACVYTSVFSGRMVAQKGKKNEKEVCVFKAKVFVVDEMALQTVGYLICNLISMAQPFRGWVNLIFCLDWVSLVRVWVCVSLLQEAKY